MKNYGAGLAIGLMFVAGLLWPLHALAEDKLTAGCPGVSYELHATTDTSAARFTSNTCFELNGEFGTEQIQLQFRYLRALFKRAVSEERLPGEVAFIDGESACPYLLADGNR